LPVSSVNLLTREVALKVVYYGPGLGGKTSTLQYIHRALKPDSRGQLVSLATGVDRTLYFDFLPVKLPKLRGFSVRVQLYTVPGQVHYNSTRKLVLTGADGVVFVADSQKERQSANVESLENLVENLREQGLQLRSIPLVFQYNKRDAPDAVNVADMDVRLNALRVPSFETIAPRGKGVFESLKAITSLTLNELRRKGSLQSPYSSDPAAPQAPAGLTNSAPVALTDSGRHLPSRATPPVGVPIHTQPEESTVLTLSSLGEVAEAIEKLAPADHRSNSGARPLPISAGSTSRALSELVGQGTARDALLLVEGDIEKGDWAAAIRRAGLAFEELSTRLAGSLAGAGSTEAAPLAALLTGLPAARYLRFREAAQRAASSGAVSSSDAIFALFFLTDFALRADELRKG
jgi:signal recognition particle receptor subunit beta